MTKVQQFIFDNGIIDSRVTITNRERNQLEIHGYACIDQQDRYDYVIEHNGDYIVYTSYINSDSPRDLELLKLTGAIDEE